MSRKRCNLDISRKEVSRKGHNLDISREEVSRKQHNLDTSQKVVSKIMRIWTFPLRKCPDFLHIRKFHALQLLPGKYPHLRNSPHTKKLQLPKLQLFNNCYLAIHFHVNAFAHKFNTVFSIQQWQYTFIQI